MIERKQIEKLVAARQTTLDNIVRVTLYNVAIDMSVDTTLLTTIMYVWGVLPFMWIGASILYGIVYTIRRGGEGN